jgi:hypothetical protein
MMPLINQIDYSLLNHEFLILRLIKFTRTVRKIPKWETPYLGSNFDTENSDVVENLHLNLESA